jgi:hypothetical protein
MRDPMTDNHTPLAPNGALDRLQFVSAFFALCAGSSAIGTVFAVLTIVRPKEGWQWHDGIGNPYVRLVGIAFTTLALAHTHLSLRRRQRFGVLSAGGWLAAALVGAIWTRDFSWSLLIPGAGLAILASAWRHLFAT